MARKISKINLGIEGEYKMCFHIRRISTLDVEGRHAFAIQRDKRKFNLQMLLSTEHISFNFKTPVGCNKRDGWKIS